MTPPSSQAAEEQPATPDERRAAQFSYSSPAPARRLDQLLDWASYRTREVHDREMASLFVPAWHCVALDDDIPHAGDYVAIEHLGLPLLVQNQGDRLAAFHNVCPHRSALVARAPRGNMPRITCGYHGWEFDRDGVACRIPGGEQFKPLKAREFSLDRIRVERLERLVFVTLDPRTPPLREFLGEEMWRRLSYAFSPNLRPVDTWTVDYDCNWKVLVENTLEDYHVTMVHRATAGETVPGKQIEHTLDPRFNAYENRGPNFDSRAMRWLAAQLRRDAEHTYFQYVSYPSLIFVSSPTSSHLHRLVPTSPTTCRAVITLFLPSGNGRLLGRAIHRLIRAPASRLTRRFVEEDRLVCADVQRGIDAARFPGVLGGREERVHAFQEYVQAAMVAASAAAPPPAAPLPSRRRRLA